MPRRGAQGRGEEEDQGGLRDHAGQGALRGIADRSHRRVQAPCGARGSIAILRGRQPKLPVDKTIGTPPHLL